MCSSAVVHNWRTICRRSTSSIQLIKNWRHHDERNIIMIELTNQLQWTVALIYSHVTNEPRSDWSPAQNGDTLRLEPHSDWSHIQIGALLQTDTNSDWRPAQIGATLILEPLSDWSPAQNGVMLRWKFLISQSSQYKLIQRYENHKSTTYCPQLNDLWSINNY